jgi:hypothetical protein
VIRIEGRHPLGRGTQGLQDWSPGHQQRAGPEAAGVQAIGARGWVTEGERRQEKGVLFWI